MQERILVTGTTGFIGWHVARRLREAGAQVIPMVRGEGPRDSAARRASLQDEAALGEAVRDVDVIVHLAGLTRARSEAEFIDTNAEGVARLVAAARQRAPRLRRFVYVSSLAAAGPSSGAAPVCEEDSPRPVSAYGRSKLLGEIRLREGAGPMPWTIVRPPIVYGPRERDLLTMFRCAARGIAPLIGDGNLYSVVHVEDLAAAIQAAIGSPAAEGEVFHVAEERPYSGREMLAHLSAAVGRDARVVPIPRFIATLYAAAGSLAARVRRRPPLVTLEKLPELRQSWVCSGAKLLRACGFHCAIPFAEGARSTADWYRREGWL